MENNLITISKNKIGLEEVNSVNARELYKYLESKRRFADWIKDRIEKYKFVDGVDYISIHKIVKTEGVNVAKPLKEYIITLDVAKEFAMLENNKKGREIRKYFIEIEKKYRKQLPDTFVKALRSLADEVEKNEVLQLENNKQLQVIKEYEPKVEYYDMILNTSDTLTTTQIAKDYGLTAQELNKILYDEKIQYKQSGQWLLYSVQASKGYTKSQTFNYKHKNGTEGINLLTKWTQKGRILIHNILKNQDIIPNVDKEEERNVVDLF